MWSENQSHVNGGILSLNVEEKPEMMKMGEMYANAIKKIRK
jgi:hypothetical protein